jgi:hypothetical protein
MAVYKSILSVSANELIKIIPHNLNDVDAVLVAAKPRTSSGTGWATTVYETERDANNITLAFTIPAPANAFVSCKVET